MSNFRLKSLRMGHNNHGHKASRRALLERANTVASGLGQATKLNSGSGSSNHLSATYASNSSTSNGGSGSRPDVSSCVNSPLIRRLRLTRTGSGDSFDLGKGSPGRRVSGVNGGGSSSHCGLVHLASADDDDDDYEENVYGIALAGSGEGNSGAGGGRSGDPDDIKSFRRFCRGSLKRLRRAESKVSVAKRDMEEILAQAKVLYSSSISGF